MNCKRLSYYTYGCLLKKYYIIKTCFMLRLVSVCCVSDINCVGCWCNSEHVWLWILLRIVVNLHHSVTAYEIQKIMKQAFVVIAKKKKI